MFCSFSMEFSVPKKYSDVFSGGQLLHWALKCMSSIVSKIWIIAKFNYSILQTLARTQLRPPTQGHNWFPWDFCTWVCQANKKELVHTKHAGSESSAQLQLPGSHCLCRLKVHVMSIQRPFCSYSWAFERGLFQSIVLNLLQISQRVLITLRLLAFVKGIIFWQDFLMNCLPDLIKQSINS